eukprot:tig00020830_g14388.t1
MATLNIGGDPNDPTYRYKMPRLLAKVEGRGNGIKTVIPNMADIARSLHRPPSYPTKFFGCELGAQSKWDEKANFAVVNGNHDQATLARLLTGFIDKFVLCATCKLPEADIEIDKKECIHLQCKACGANSMVDMRHKLCTFILNNPPEPSKGGAKTSKKGSKKKDGSSDDEKSEKKEKKEKGEKSEKTDKGEKKEKKSKKKKDESEDDDVDWGEDVSAEAVERRRLEALGDIKSVQIQDVEIPVETPKAANGDGSSTPKGDKKKKKEKKEKEAGGAAPTVEELKAFASDDKSPSEINSFLKKAGVEDKAERVRLVFDALFAGEGLLAAVKAKGAILKKVAGGDADSQAELLACIERAALADAAGLKGFPNVLKSLYDQDAITEEAAIAWHKKGPANDARTKATPFVDWLQNASEESDDEKRNKKARKKGVRTPRVRLRVGRGESRRKKMLASTAQAARSVSSAALLARLGLNPTSLARAASSAYSASSLNSHSIQAASNAARLSLRSLASTADRLGHSSSSRVCFARKFSAATTPSQRPPESPKRSAGKRFQPPGGNAVAEGDAAEGEGEPADEDQISDFFETGESLVRAVRGVDRAGMGEAQLDEALSELLKEQLGGIGEVAKGRLLNHAVRSLLNDEEEPALAESIARVAPHIVPVSPTRWLYAFTSYYLPRNDSAWLRWKELCCGPAGADPADPALRLQSSIRIDFACGHIMRGEWETGADLVHPKDMPAIFLLAAWRVACLQNGAVAGSTQGLAPLPEILSRFAAERAKQEQTASEDGGRRLLGAIFQPSSLVAASAPGLAKCVSEFAAALRAADPALGYAGLEFAWPTLRAWGAVEGAIAEHLPDLPARAEEVAGTLRAGGPGALAELSADEEARPGLRVAAALELAATLAASKGASEEQLRRAGDAFVYAAHCAGALHSQTYTSLSRAVTGAAVELALSSRAGDAFVLPLKAVGSLPNGLQFLGGQNGLNDLAAFAFALGNARSAAAMIAMGREHRRTAGGDAGSNRRALSSEPGVPFTGPLRIGQASANPACLRPGYGRRRVPGEGRGAERGALRGAGAGRWVLAAHRASFERTVTACQDALNLEQIPRHLGSLATAAGYSKDKARGEAVEGILQQAGRADYARALAGPVKLLMTLREMEPEAVASALRDLEKTLEREEAKLASTESRRGEPGRDRAALIQGMRRAMVRNASVMAALHFALPPPEGVAAPSHAIRAVHRAIELTGELPETLLRALYRCVDLPPERARGTFAKLWTKLRLTRRHLANASRQRSRSSASGGEAEAEAAAEQN